MLGITIQTAVNKHQNIVITFATAVFCVYRYTHMVTPVRFFSKCISYGLFTLKYNVIFRYMASSEKFNINSTFGEQILETGRTLLLPLPDFLPSIPIIRNKNGPQLFIILSWDFIFNRKKAIKKAFQNYQKNLQLVASLQ